MINIVRVYSQSCTERFPLPSAAQLEELEQRIGVRFPEDYRRYILALNGGCFSDAEITPMGEGCPLAHLDIMYGIGAPYPVAELGAIESIALFDDNDPPQIVPIGRTALGHLIILDTAPGDGQGAVFLKQAFGEFYYLVDGIEAFFALLREPTVT